MFYHSQVPQKVLRYSALAFTQKSHNHSQEVAQCFRVRLWWVLSLSLTFKLLISSFNTSILLFLLKSLQKQRQLSIYDISYFFITYRCYRTKILLQDKNNIHKNSTKKQKTRKLYTRQLPGMKREQEQARKTRRWQGSGKRQGMRKGWSTRCTTTDSAIKNEQSVMGLGKTHGHVPISANNMYTMLVDDTSQKLPAHIDQPPHGDVPRFDELVCHVDESYY